jgi:hypothetical protein
MNGHEIAKDSVKTVRASSSSHSIGALQSSHPNKKFPSNSSSFQKGNSSAPCMGCGKTGHVIKDTCCPALGKRCRACQKLNHFDSVCITSRKIGAMKTLTATLGSLGQIGDSKIKCSVSLHRTTTSKATPFIFAADSCADVSTLTESAYNKHFNDVPISSTTTRLRNFDSSEIVQPRGTINLLVTFQKLTASVDFFIVPNKCFTVLGLPDMGKLHMLIDTYQCTVTQAPQNPPLPPTKAGDVQSVPMVQHLIPSPDELKDSDLRNPSLFKSILGGGDDTTQLTLSMEDRNNAVNFKSEKSYGFDATEPKQPYQVGDLVRYKLPPISVRKGTSPFSQPLRVIQILGRWNYRLSDGQPWNARKLSRYRPHSVPDPEIAKNCASSACPRLTTPRLTTPRRSQRVNAGIPPRRFSPSPPRTRR